MALTVGQVPWANSRTLRQLLTSQAFCQSGGHRWCCSGFYTALCIEPAPNLFPGVGVVQMTSFTFGSRFGEPRCFVILVVLFMMRRAVFHESNPCQNCQNWVAYYVIDRQPLISPYGLKLPEMNLLQAGKLRQRRGEIRLRRTGRGDGDVTRAGGKR